MNARDWSRYARALDMKLAGETLEKIGAEFGVSRERARQIVHIAARRLAHRVFVGVPSFEWRWDWEMKRWMRSE